MTPSPVKRFAVDCGVDVLQPEKASEQSFSDALIQKDPDLIVVVAYGQILKKSILMIPRWGVLNIHASLLPQYRGAAPIQAAVLNRDTITGLTLMLLDEGLDTGPILFQEEVSIFQDETAGQLHDRLAQKAGDFMTTSLKRMSETPMKGKPQDHSMATYAPKIDRALTRIDWRKTAPEIAALIRALDPRPGANSIWQGEKIKLFSSSVSEVSPLGAPGEILHHGEDSIIIGTGLGAVRIRELQYPGRKRLPAASFLRGCPLPIGMRFENKS